MKKTIATLVCLLLLATVIMAACAPTTAPTPEKVVETKVVEVEKIVEVPQEAPEDPIAVAKAFLKGKKICAVLPGPVNDAGWNTSAYLGLVNLRDNFGMEIAYHERTEPEEAAALMREYAEAGCSIIQAHGFEYFDQLNAVALEYPDIQFMQLSRCAGQEPNLIGLCYVSGEGGYFVGRMAAQITKTGKVAVIPGTSYPNLSYNTTMAQQAAKDLGLDVIVEEHEVGSWEDPAKAKELTQALIEQDFDVFVLIADAGDVGIIEAIKEARAAGKTVMAISWVKDKNYLGTDFVIGGWEEQADMQMEYAAVQYALKGAPIGAGFPLGVKDGVNRLNPTYGLIPLEVEKDVFDLFMKYKEDPASLPTLVVRDDL